MILAALSRLFAGWTSGNPSRAEDIPETGTPSFVLERPDQALIVRRKGRPYPVFNWTCSGSSLAPTAWSAGASVSNGTVLRTAGGFYVLYQGSGTTAASGNGPNVLGSQSDNNVTCLVVPEFGRGIAVFFSSGTPLVGSPGNPLIPISTTSGLGIAFDDATDPSLWGLSGGTVIVAGTP